MLFQDTLRRIKKRYETDCREYGREPTIPVEKSVAEAKKEADQVSGLLNLFLLY
jgi:hypothetical protein